MRNRPVPTGIALQNVDGAFEAGQAVNIRIIGESPKSWMFTFDVADPVTGKPQEFTLLTQRGQVRYWSDPRNLLQFLADRYGVAEGSFILLGGGEHEEGESG
ncbi:KorA protein [Caballeronia sp. TF1N1]|uniref:KorA protein n=1 Tax=Caballeronia sp. TF1N1 TaxID=2878153 RepID=UPI001FD5CD6A|nr:KorA protein [Caballeronia sp. TF1N1]